MPPLQTILPFALLTDAATASLSRSPFDWTDDFTGHDYFPEDAERIRQTLLPPDGQADIWYSSQTQYLVAKPPKEIRQAGCVGGKKHDWWFFCFGRPREIVFLYPRRAYGALTRRRRICYACNTIELQAVVCVSGSWHRKHGNTDTYYWVRP